MELKVLALVLVLVSSAAAWSDGYSITGGSVYENWSVMWDEYNYGTHDYLAERAIGFLSENETNWTHDKEFYYGTEFPDSDAREGLNDALCCQHIYFNPNGSVRDDIMAWKSMRKYNLTLDLLRREANSTASKWAGSMTHYIADAGLWGRLLGYSAKSKIFEDFIMVRTDLIYPSSDFEDLFSSYISFDGSLDMLSPYEAVMRVANATYFGENNGSCSAEWMETHYNTSDPEFLRCAGRNFNNIVNAIADVLHTLYTVGFENASYEVYPTDWSEARLPIWVTLSAEGGYDLGERITVVATPSRAVSYPIGREWTFYMKEGENWTRVENATICGVPLCNEVCNTTNLTICDADVGCSTFHPPQALTWAWDQGAKSLSTIDCDPPDKSWSKGEDCLESAQVEPGVYKVTFEYDYVCPLSSEHMVAERNFTIRAPAEEEVNQTIQEPEEPEPVAGTNLDWLLPYLIIIAAIPVTLLGIKYALWFARRLRRKNHPEHHKQIKPKKVSKPEGAKK
jgi:hypothetical protein